MTGNVEGGAALDRHRPNWRSRLWRYRYFGVIAILVACLSISIASVATKALLENTPVLPVVFVQLSASTIVIWTAAAMTGRLPKGRRALTLALPGILQPGLVYVFAFLGLAIVPVSLEGLLFAFEAAIVALLAWPFLGERPSVWVGISILMGATGVILLSWPQQASFAAPLLGVVLILAGVVCASLDTVASRALAIHADPLTMTAAGHIAGLAVVGGALLVSGRHPWDFLSNPQAVALIVLSGLLIHAFPTVLFNAALVRTSAGQAAALFPAISLFTAMGGYVVLDERLGLLQLGGGLMIVGSALLIAWRHGAEE
ncbi:MAG TPA: DMT family transporter [Stellaceae bacterium]|nr:DMT family transporter [Stellaceae bacterium]